MARRRLSLAWLKPPPVPPGGVMSLSDHLRELRYRLIAALVGVVAAAAVSAVFYNQLYLLLMQPWLAAVEVLKQSNPQLTTTAVITGVATPFLLALKVCLVAGLVVASPWWLYQLWAFIVPALHDQERRWALRFLAVAVPLFLLGVSVGYLILPQGIAVMMAFTPASFPVTNMLDVNNFLELLLRMMVVAGLAFELPVFVMGLNLAGVVTGAQLAKVRVYVIFGTFVFGAAATPSSDPFSMLALAIPMTVLYLGAEVFCRVHDKRKARKLALAEAT